MVRIALIVADFIKPFSDFKPKITEGYREWFETLEKEGNPPPLYVYPKGKYFITSDDYNSYYLYKEKGGVD